MQHLGWDGRPPALPELLKSWCVHGGKGVGQRLVNLLERATTMELHDSTWGQRAALLAEQHLVTLSESRYCPVCVQQGDAYGQLLWETSCVTACPLHGVRLRDAKTCGAPHLALTRAQRPRLSHVCNSCGSIGFRCIEQEPETASEDELWTARSAASVLAAPRATVVQWTDDTLREGLRALLDASYGGSVVKAAQAAALGRGTVCTWLKGGARPNLRDLLKLCHTCEADVQELMGGKYVRLTAPDDGAEVRAADPSSKRGYLQRLLAPDLEDLLRQAAGEVPPPTLRAFAERHGTYAERLRKKWPELAQALVAAGQSYREAEWRGRQEEAVQVYERAVPMLLESGLPVTPKYLQEATGLVAFSRNKPRVIALQRVVAKHARADAA